MSEHVALVTGAEERIGSAIAKSILDSSYKAVLVGINRDFLAHLECHIEGTNHLSIVSDGSAPDATDRCIASAVERFGRFDAAIHSAYPRSFGQGARFEEIKKSIWMKFYWSRHLGGAILISRRMLEFFKS